jgi:hypothetical protein
MTPPTVQFIPAAGVSAFASIEGTTDFASGPNGSQDNDPTYTGTSATFRYITLYGTGTFSGAFYVTFNNNTDRDQFVSDIPDSTSGTTYVYELSTDSGSTWSTFYNPTGWTWRVVNNEVQLRGDFGALPNIGITQLPAGTMYRMFFY